MQTQWFNPLSAQWEKLPAPAEIELDARVTPDGGRCEYTQVRFVRQKNDLAEEAGQRFLKILGGMLVLAFVLCGFCLLLSVIVRGFLVTWGAIWY